MANRMAANIATMRARIGNRHKPKLPHPHADECRHDGFVCSACLRWGRQGCKQHRQPVPDERN